MSRRGRARFAEAIGLVALLAAGGCFDSLVSGECRPGWEAVEGACRLVSGDPDASDGEDAGEADDARVAIDAGVDAPLDAAVCASGSTWCGACVDVAVDPDHCGACGVACASGICGAGVCEGTLPGHVLLIGHDYRARRAGEVRLLGNAISLGGGPSIRVGIWTAGAEPATADAVAQALTEAVTGTGVAQLVSTAAPPQDRSSIDVFVVLPQARAPQDAVSLGLSWQGPLTAFIGAGGIVVGLDGPGTTTVDTLRAASLLEASAGAEVTGQRLTIAAPGDALAVGVPSPFLASSHTVTFAAPAEDAVVVAPDGAPVVLHRVRP